MVAPKWLSGIEKEPDEVKFKGIDLSQWLEVDESIEDIEVHIYEPATNPLREYDLSDVAYVSITTYDSDHNIVNQTTEWEMVSAWDKLKVMAEGVETQSETTDTMVVTNLTGYSDPSKQIQRTDEGGWRVGIKNGEVGKDYHAMIKFSTDAHRVEKVHFMIEVRDMSGLTS